MVALRPDRSVNRRTVQMAPCRQEDSGRKIQIVAAFRYTARCRQAGRAFSEGGQSGHRGRPGERRYRGASAWLGVMRRGCGPGQGRRQASLVGWEPAVGPMRNMPPSTAPLARGRAWLPDGIGREGLGAKSCPAGSLRVRVQPLPAQPQPRRVERVRSQLWPGVTGQAFRTRAWLAEDIVDLGGLAFHIVRAGPGRRFAGETAGRRRFGRCR